MNEERKRILQKVKEGKLTVDEAMIFLEALENQNTNQKDEPKKPSTHVDWENSHSSQKEFKQSSVKTKFADFIESTIQKIKSVDLDFNFGPSIEVDHIFQHRDVYINYMDIDVSNGEIKIVPWDEQDVRIECQAKVYKVDNAEEAKKMFLKNVTFSVDGDRLRFSIQKKHIKIKTIFYVPQSDYDELKIRMFNGHIIGEQLNVNELKVKTANGNITLRDFASLGIETETANGHIFVENSTAKEIEAETLNGTVKVNGAFEKTDLQSFNGSIVCKLTDTNCHTAFLKTKAGAIDLYLREELEVDGVLKSNIGRFTCDLPNLEVKSEKKDVVQKEMRFISNKGQEKTLHLEVESKAGSILVNTL